MSPSTRSPDISALKLAARLAALALLVCAAVAMLMAVGVLEGSPTRFAEVGIAALAFAHWWRLLLAEIARRRMRPPERMQAEHA